MPAVQLARVKIQVGQMMADYPQPAVFIRRLHDLLDYYADRTYRPGESGGQRPRLPHYRVPAPVMRQLEADLALQATSGDQAALDMADALWADGYIETRLLAIHLLALLAPQPPEPLLTHFTTWAQATSEPVLLDRLLSSGRTRLQAERPDLWLSWIHSWLTTDTPSDQAIGLRGLLSIVDDPTFQNLPSIYNLLGPLLPVFPTSLHVEIANVIQTLARRSPSETVYFLRQVLTSVQGSESRAVSRLVRRCLPYFDPPAQTRLRTALTDRARSSE